ncbi:MAG: oligosaccharide flippase family protein [Candidatus Omnitrophota bacterium]
MKRLVKGSSVLTLVSMGEMLVRLIRTKFFALFLGPSGFGFIAQLSNFFETLRIFGDLGARQAVIRQVAETLPSGGRQTQRYRDVLSSSFVIAFSASSLTMVIVMVFSSPVSRFLFGEAGYGHFLIVMACLLPMASITTVIASVLKGNLEFSSYAKATLGAYAGLILATPFLLYRFGLWGAVALHGLFFLFPLIAYLILNLKEPFLLFSRKLQAHIIRYQFEDGTLQIYLTLVAQIIRVGIGIWIIQVLGLGSMGVYQMALAFSTVYLAIPLQAMNGYSFPAIAAAGGPEEVNEVVNNSFRFVMFLLMPAIILLMVFPEIFIQALFTEKFLVGTNTLRILLFYSLSVLFHSSFATALVAKRKLKVVYVVTALHAALLFLLTVLLTADWQLEGIALAFAVSGVLLAAAFYTAARHSLKIYFFPKNLRLIVLSGIWLAGAAATGFMNAAWPWRAGVLVFAIPWFFIAAKSHEQKFIFGKIISWWGK